MIPTLQKSIQISVATALAEDIGSGDVTVQLIKDNKIHTAQVITRDAAILCGQAWVDATFKTLDPTIDVNWCAKDGDAVTAGQILFTVTGKVQTLLTAERTALNFLQLLSGTATVAHQYVKKIAHTSTKILDTRKTIVGLRLAQKYAVVCGGGHNHRLGLYDAFLIKENHIIACGSITAAVNNAKQLHPDLPIEVEVETLEQLAEAISADADQVLLDNFDLDMIKQAVTQNRGRVTLEVSGGIHLNNIVPIAETGVDYISVGAMTKNLQSVDLSMRIFSRSLQLS